LLSIYKVVTTKEELLQQFNFDAIFSDINKNKEIREPLFTKFWLFLNELNTKEKCQSVLKFITGSIKIPTRRQIMVNLLITY